MQHAHLLWLSVLTCCLLSQCQRPPHTARATDATRPSRPNIIYILADDLGYGDLTCYNPEARIATPHLDRLAREGMRLTDAHSPSSVCTPTRYALLSGRYAWRSRLPQGVLRGYGRALLEPERLTVPELLQQQGYRTGVVGKWHLGLDWVLHPGHEYALAPGQPGVTPAGVVTEMAPEHIDFRQPPRNGPRHHGFDYSFILPASLDMDPYCYLENDTLLHAPTAHTPGNDLNTGYTGAFWRAGRMAPDFDFYGVLPTFTERALDFVRESSQRPQPFFLYWPLAAPHTPWVPTVDYASASGAGTYGDFVQMVDAEVGRLLALLDSLQLSEETLLIFTSDNGPYWRPAHIEQYDHRAAGPWRGMKADIWEGGHRVPFLARWPGKIPAASHSDATTSLTHLLATCAELLGVTLPAGAGEDSYSILSVMQGRADTVAGQPAIIHHSGQGVFAIRQGPWKYIEGLGSGGFSVPVRRDPMANEPAYQLYNLEVDPQESLNLATSDSARAAQLAATLRRIRTAGKE